MAEELPPTASPSPKSTRSARSATSRSWTAQLSRPFQSTRSARSATDIKELARNVVRISIHALRKERDVDQAVPLCPRHNFNPRAPQGARPSLRSSRTRTEKFQSTRSARSATQYLVDHNIAKAFQSTRSARSATARHAEAHHRAAISIHALRKERDRG